MTRKKLILGIIILIAAVLIINEVVAYWPYLVVGAPLGIFGVNNTDSTNHSVGELAEDEGFSSPVSSPSETSVKTVNSTIIPTVTPTATSRVEASVYLESSAENITIYVPVLLDENNKVLKMYDTPVIIGKVTTSILDTEHGKALKISKSGKSNNNEIHFQEQDEKLKEDAQTPEQKSDEFFSRFTISMSNYKAPDHFISMPPDPNIDAWVYSDTEIDKFSFSFDIDPRTTLYESDMGSAGIALGISPQGWWVHLRKGWQEVKLSRGQIAWDAVRAPTTG